MHQLLNQLPNHIRLKILEVTVTEKLKEIKDFADMSSILLTAIANEVQVRFVCRFDDKNVLFY